MTWIAKFTCACLCVGFAMAAAADSALAQPAGGISQVAVSSPHQDVLAIRSSPAMNHYQGNRFCSGCHSGEGNFLPDVRDRVCLTEYKTWLNADRHSHAYASLSATRGKRMGELLGKDVLAPATGCIQCHSIAVRGAALPNDRQERETLLADGVSCEACHGPSTTWIDPHYKDAESWRNQKLEDKTAAGWINVSSPVTRAEVCNSCHLGSEEFGRLITHEMYAAGHPPLSGFEIESFVDKMPRHWRYSNEQPAPDGRPASASFDRTRNVLVASVVSVRMAVELAMADARAGANRWPELARLDCFACHHELVEPAWRQARQVSATPGRPQLCVGCVPLVAIAAELANVPGAENVDAATAKMNRPFDTDVFGDPAMIVEQGAAVVSWCEALERQLESMNFQGEQGGDVARTVLRKLAERSEARCDYDTARQLYGAWSVVYTELVANHAIQLSHTDQAALDKELARVSRSDPFVLERQRIKPPCEVPPDSNQTPAARGEQLEKSVQNAFTTRRKYDPDIFADLMAKLAELTD
jgi:hypothetical protein